MRDFEIWPKWKPVMGKKVSLFPDLWPRILLTRQLELSTGLIWLRIKYVKVLLRVYNDKVKKQLYFNCDFNNFFISFVFSTWWGSCWNQDLYYTDLIRIIPCCSLRGINLLFWLFVFKNFSIDYICLIDTKIWVPKNV